LKKEPLLLVFDAGTGSARCLVFDSRGNLLVKQAAPWHYQATPGGRTVFDPAVWWATLVGLGRAALAQVDPAQVVALSATSQRQGFVGFDREGREIIGWPNLDRSIRSPLDEATADRFYDRVGRWPGTVHTAPRLAADPTIFTFLPLSDWILYRLGGQSAIEPSQAAESCLFNVKEGRWSPEASAAFGLEGRRLPPLRRAGTNLGELSEVVAGELGLRPGLPVVAGGADTQCGTLGCGVVAPGQMALVAGTSAPLQLCLKEPVFDAERRTITGPYLLENRWVLESNAMFNGLSFARLKALAAPDLDYVKLNQRLAESGSAFTGLPFCIGASIMDSRRGSVLPWGGMFFPLPFAEYEPLTVLRAALESAAFAVRANLEQLERVMGRAFPPDTPLVMGGGASQGYWPQLVADALGRTVTVSAEPEVSGLGAAICAATGAGLFGGLEQATEGMARSGAQFAPQTVPNLEQFYRRWLEAYKGLAGLNLAQDFIN
jgi:autoinducer 2 (AI-2) kinase